MISESVDLSSDTITDVTSSPLRRRSRARRPDEAKSSPCSSPARDCNSSQRKRRAIQKAAKPENFEVSTLRQLAISPEGLLSNDMRKLAWPKLLHVDIDNIPIKPDQETLHGHRDYNQVVLDVNRSLKRFPPGMEERVRLSMQDQLVDVIMWVLVTHPELHYYQGYHDIVVTFLLVLGEEHTFGVMEKLSKQHLRDFMDETMDKTTHKLNYLYPIIGRACPELKIFMERAEAGTIFALSWLITWFGHVLNDIRHIVRLYDFFIACHPLMPIYLAASIVLYRKDEILTCEPEMAMIHCLLSRIPDDLPYEYLMQRAGDLSIQYPPSMLVLEAKKHYERSRVEESKFEAARAARRAAVKRSYFSDANRSSPKRILVQVTFWTLTAIFSAAAFVMVRPKLDVDWLWGH